MIEIGPTDAELEARVARLVERTTKARALRDRPMNICAVCHGTAFARCRACLDLLCDPICAGIHRSERHSRRAA